jgi:PadR family transcriptional regulator PadR
MKDNFQDQLRKGSTVVLILTVLSEQPMYGYQISRELGQRSQGYFEMKEGLLYPALHQMEESGLIASDWKVIENRRRRYYRITSQGIRYLSQAAGEWKTFVTRLFGLIGDVQQ